MALILKAFNSRRYSKWWLASCEVFSTLLCCERIVLLYFKAWKVCVAQVCTPRFERTSRGFVWCTCARPTTARVPSKTRSFAAARNCFWTDFEVYARHPRYLVSCGSTSKLCTRRLRMALTRQNSIARGPRERSQVLRMSSHAFCRTLQSRFCRRMDSDTREFHFASLRKPLFEATKLHLWFLFPTMHPLLRFRTALTCPSLKRYTSIDYNAHDAPQS